MSDAGQYIYDRRPDPFDSGRKNRRLENVRRTRPDVLVALDALAFRRPQKSLHWRRISGSMQAHNILNFLRHAACYHPTVAHENLIVH